MRRFVFSLILLVGPGLFLTASPASATAGGADNVVLASNTVDNASVARDRIQIAHDPMDTVANQNIASAQSTGCTGCRTVAVAMQVILVESSPHDFEPANAAVASNGGCDSCQTYAFAFQYVIQPGQVVYLSGAAQQQLAQLRAQADAIASSDLTAPDMQVALDAVFAQVVSTVNTQMQAAGASSTGQVWEATRIA